MPHSHVGESNRVELRPYAPEDFQQLYEIDQACYPPEIAYSRAELRDYLGLPGADCILAETQTAASAVNAERGAGTRRDSSEVQPRNSRNASVIGFCLSAHRGGAGHIITLDVLDPYRRRGVASRLLGEAEGRLAEHRVTIITLETAVDNAPAVAFWRVRGYTTRAIIRGYYPGPRDAYSMRKIL